MVAGIPRPIAEKPLTYRIAFGCFSSSFSELNRLPVIIHIKPSREGSWWSYMIFENEIEFDFKDFIFTSQKK